jgi:hypothetical protein
MSFDMKVQNAAIKSTRLAAAAVLATLAACGFSPKTDAPNPPAVNTGSSEQAAVNSLNTGNSLNSLNTLNSLNGQNSLNSLNAANSLNSLNTLNVRNSLNTLNSLNSLNGYNSLNTLNTLNAANTLNTLNVTNTLNTLNSQLGLTQAFPAGFAAAPQTLCSIINLGGTSRFGPPLSTAAAGLAGAAPSSGPAPAASTPLDSAPSAPAPSSSSTPTGSSTTPLVAYKNCDISHYSVSQIAAKCPVTTIQTEQPAGSGYFISYALPTFITLMNKFEKVVYDSDGAQVCDGSGCIPAHHAGDDVVVNVTNQQGVTIPHKILMGFAVACSNMVVRPLFLAPLYGIISSGPIATMDVLPAATGAPLAPYEGHLDYMCLKFRDDVPVGQPPADPAWHCGAGGLGDGVIGVAARGNSPRTFIIPGFNWGPNRFDHHWEFPNLGAVAQRIPSGQQTGFALDTAWNLNPNDFHADMSSKALDYIAALALKTNTNRNGVQITVYNNRGIQDYLDANPSATADPFVLARQNPAELNQGEAEVRSCASSGPTVNPDNSINQSSSECFTYFNYIDSLSTGNVGTGADGLGALVWGVVDTKVDWWYSSRAHVFGTYGDNTACTADSQCSVGQSCIDGYCNVPACPWQTDWSVPTVRSEWRPNVIDHSMSWVYNSTTGQWDDHGGAPMQLHAPHRLNWDGTPQTYRVAVNLGQAEQRRCPTWSLCDGATAIGNHMAVFVPYDQNWSPLQPGQPSSIAVSYHSAVACPPGVQQACGEYLCGQPVIAHTVRNADHSPNPVDWWVCGGPECRQGTGDWQLGCTNTDRCALTMGDRDVYVLTVSNTQYDLVMADTAGGLGYALTFVGL